MDEPIRVHIDDTLQLDYLLQEITKDKITHVQENENIIGYTNTKSLIYQPSEIGTDTITINNQDIEIDVYDIPESVTNHLDSWFSVDRGSELELFDSLGENNVTLVEPNRSTNRYIWGSNSLIFNGVSDYGYIDSGLNLSSDKVSVCGWLYPIDDAGAAYSFVNDKNDNSSDGPGGHEVQIRDNAFRLRYTGTQFDGAGQGEVQHNGLEKWYFLAWYSNSDDGEDKAYLWDKTSLIGTNSNTTSAGVSLSSNVSFILGARDTSSNFWNGYMDMFGFNIGNELSQSDFKTIWEDTRP